MKNKKIKINLAKNAGFCGGVLRAFELVKKEFNGKPKKKGQRVLMLGSLVHNENVVKEVERWGVEKIDSLSDVKRGDVVIITAHGVGEGVLKEILQKGAKIFDATCPKVSLIHKNVKQHSQKGDLVVIFGDKEHKEVRGVGGWCGKELKVLDNFSDARQFVASDYFRQNKKPLFVVSQTTRNIEEFHQVSQLISRETKKIQVAIECVDTICRATLDRQSEAKKIAQKNDAVIVVGGRKSANTQKLFDVAKKINPNSICIEGLDGESKKKIIEMREKFSKIGILSGASTPIYDIEKVTAFINGGEKVC